MLGIIHCGLCVVTVELWGEAKGNSHIGQRK